METSYEQANKLNRELQSENLKLMASQQLLKIRLSEHVKACSMLQIRLEKTLTEKNELAISVRKLEQENDKLGQHNREIELSAKEREEQLDELLEKLAITETELTDKTEGYKILVQRLKEENTELKQQIAVDLTQQKKRSSIVKGIELATTFKLSKSNSSSSDDSSRLTADDLKQMPKNELLKHVQQLTKRFEALDIVQQRSKAAEQTMNVKYNDALEKIASFETEQDTSPREDVPATCDPIVEPEVQLRAHNRRQAQLSKRHSKSTDKTRSSIKLTQEESKLLRNSMPSKLSRHVENRMKKVKEEENRQQNLSGFLKRLRQGQATNWLRRRD